jgi:hypothetical protein
MTRVATARSSYPAVALIAASALHDRSWAAQALNKDEPCTRRGTIAGRRNAAALDWGMIRLRVKAGFCAPSDGGSINSDRAQAKLVGLF